MDQSELTKLQHRLDALERRQRHMRVLVLFVGALGIAPYVIGAGSRTGTVNIDVLRAERIDLVHGDTVMVSLQGIAGKRLHDRDTLSRALGVMNANGKLTSALIADQTGGNLYLYSPKEEAVGTFYTESDGSGLSLDGANGRTSVELLARGARGGQVLVRDSAASLVGMMGARTDGTGGFVEALDRHEHAVAWLTSRPDSNAGGGLVGIADSTGQSRAFLFSDNNGAGRFALFGHEKDGRADVLLYTTTKDGKWYGNVDVLATDQKRPGTFYADRDGGNMELHNSADTLVAQMVSRSGDLGGELSVFTNEGKYAAMMSAASYGGRFIVYNSAAQITGRLVSRSDGVGGEMTLYGRSANPVAATFARPDGSGADMQVMNSDGKVVGGFFATSDGQGRLQLYDRAGAIVRALP